MNSNICDIYFVFTARVWVSISRRRSRAHLLESSVVGEMRGGDKSDKQRLLRDALNWPQQRAQVKGRAIAISLASCQRASLAFARPLALKRHAAAEHAAGGPRGGPTPGPGPGPAPRPPLPRARCRLSRPTHRPQGTRADRNARLHWIQGQFFLLSFPTEPNSYSHFCIQNIQKLASNLRISYLFQGVLLFLYFPIAPWLTAKKQIFNRLFMHDAFMQTTKFS